MFNFLKSVVQMDDIDSNEKQKNQELFKEMVKEVNEEKEVTVLNEGVTNLDLKGVKVETVKEPIVLEKEVEIPVVKEKVVPQVEEVVQPVIMREKETTEVRHITQPIFKKEVLPTRLVNTSLPTTNMPDTIEKPTDSEVKKYYEAHNRAVDTTEVLEAQVHRTVLPPIVKEKITPIIHEEIQPVIYQETIQPVVITETKPVYHKVVEAPRVIEEVRPMKTMEEARSLLEKIGTSTVTTVEPLSGQGLSKSNKTGQQ